MQNIVELGVSELSDLRALQTNAMIKVLACQTQELPPNPKDFGHVTIGRDLVLLLDLFEYVCWEQCNGVGEAELELVFGFLLENFLRCSWVRRSGLLDNALVLFSRESKAFFHPPSEFCYFRSGCSSDMKQLVLDLYKRLGYPPGVSLLFDLSLLYSSNFLMDERRFLEAWGFSAPEKLTNDEFLMDVLFENEQLLSWESFPCSFLKGEPDWNVLEFVLREQSSKSGLKSEASGASN